MTGHGARLELAGERVEFLPERVLWWPARRTALVADLHLGKEDVFQASGIPVPGGTTRTDLTALSALVRRLGAERLVVLGDFLHGRNSLSDTVLDALAQWCQELASCQVVLVRGNHDRSAGDPPAALGLQVVDGPWPMGPFLLRHEPSGVAGTQGPGGDGGGAAAGRGGASDAGRPADAGGPEDHASPTPAYEIAGHLHPAVRLEGRGRDRLRVPCFWVRPTQCVLPAFGGFTGSGRIRPLDADRIFVVGEGQVMEVPLR